MSALETAREQLEAALSRLEAGLGAAVDRARQAPDGGDTEAQSGLLEELRQLRAEHERLAAELNAIRSERDTQKQINRSVVEALDIAIGRLDTILAE